MYRIENELKQTLAKINLSNRVSITAKWDDIKLRKSSIVHCGASSSRLVQFDSSNQAKRQL